jgi:hypothetical protein
MDLRTREFVFAGNLEEVERKSGAIQLLEEILQEATGKAIIPNSSSVPATSRIHPRKPWHELPWAEKT